MSITLETPNPDFRAVIGDDTIQLNKLRIPRKFVKKHGSELSSPVRLTVPEGVTFHVEVAKSNDGHVWFEDGWKQFSEHYCLKTGYFLLFEYEGNRSFQVLPFDLKRANTADYPYISDSDDEGDKECQQPHNEEEQAAAVKDNTSADVLNQTPSKSETTEKHCPPEKRTEPTSDYISVPDHGGDEGCQQPNKEVEGEAAAARDNNSTEVLNLNQTPPDSETGERHDPPNKRRKTISDKIEGLEPCKGTARGVGSGWECPELAVILRFRRLTAEQKAKILQISSSFNSKNPFFLNVIPPSCKTSNYANIPTDFAKKYLTETPEGKATLCLSDGKSWSVKYLLRDYQEKYPRALFSAGWKKFSRDNCLVPGDICVFELLEGSEIRLQVVIHRVADFTNRDTSKGKKATRAATGLASNVPIFKTYSKPGFLYRRECRMKIPFELVEKHCKS